MGVRQAREHQVVSATGAINMAPTPKPALLSADGPSALCVHLRKGTVMANEDRQMAPRPIGRRRPIIAKVRQVDNQRRIAVSPDDKQVAEWRARMKQIFATASPLFVEASIQQLTEASKLPREGVATTTSLSAALELIASLQPENEAQAAVAVHIACLHTATINVLKRMHDVGERNMVAVAAAAAKLELAFHGAIETFYRVKRGASQVIRIEKVEVQSGGKAVVGFVDHK
jgi:hypothetical protein